jgi:hypothetical protein
MSDKYLVKVIIQRIEYNEVRAMSEQNAIDYVMNYDLSYDEDTESIHSITAEIMRDE